MSDDRDIIITAAEIDREHGREVYRRMLKYRWHHHDSLGRAFWTAEAAARALGLIEGKDGRPRHDP
jgi:hypothetical protein